MAKNRFELWGETLRDLGILTLVFVPLDSFVEYMKDGGSPTVQKHLGIITFFTILGFILIVGGVEIERR